MTCMMDTNAMEETINAYHKNAAKCIKSWRRSIRCGFLDFIIQQYCSSSSPSSSSSSSSTSKRRQVLDIGCGLGLDALRFANESDCDVFAIDKTRDFLQFARSTKAEQQQANTLNTNSSVKFIDCDFAKIFTHKVISQQTFDIFWANASLIHLPKEDCAHILSQLPSIGARQCIFGGIFSDGKSEGYTSGRFVPGRYFSKYTKSELQDMFESSGWHVVSIGDAENYGRSGEWIQVLATLQHQGHQQQQKSQKERAK